ncbi:MAG: STAS domain-containing protein [Desulfobacteraceae bacterium]|nr:STAS domain-containing protein [Desulfobacteraceae bacterium]MCB9494861.1 STAS domain-containing protein [Desulfobacteraceae bacterium]
MSDIRKYGKTILKKINFSNVTQKITSAGYASLSKENLLTDEEVHDYTHEFVELFSSLLEDSRALSGETFNALKHLMATVNAKIQMRGGSTESFLQLMHFIQYTFMDEIVDDENEKNDRELLFLLKFFNNLVMEAFRLYQKEREDALKAQKEEFLAVSTPITEIWDGVLSLPVIGTLDSGRAMDLMEKLLERIELRRSKVIILDLTGVSTIDTQVMHHLIQVIRATALMGATAVLTGIRPSIARSLANLNINLDEIQTKSTLSEGLKEAFRILGIKVEKN